MYAPEFFPRFLYWDQDQTLTKCTKNSQLVKSRWTWCDHIYSRQQSSVERNIDWNSNSWDVEDWATWRDILGYTDQEFSIAREPLNKSYKEIRKLHFNLTPSLRGHSSPHQEPVIRCQSPQFLWRFFVDETYSCEYFEKGTLRHKSFHHITWT